MFIRAIVRTWQRTMWSAMKRAISAVSLPPCSMSWRARARIFSRSLSASYHSVTRA